MDLQFEASLMLLIFDQIKYAESFKNTKKNCTIPKPINHQPTKLLPEVLASIHNSIMKDAHVNFEQMKLNIKNEMNINISKSSVSNGCAQMRYQYKPPQHSHLLNEDQKKYRVTFSNSLLTMYYKKEIDLLQINFSDESRFVLGDDKQ